MDDLIAIEEEEKISQTKKDTLHTQSTQSKIHTQAHLTNIESLFTGMFDSDKEYLKFHEIAPESIHEQVHEYSLRFSKCLDELVSFVLTRNAILDSERKNFEDCKQATKKEHDDECKARLKEFIKFKKGQIRICEGHGKETDIEEVGRRVKESAEEVSNFLMLHEMQIVGKT